MQWTDVSTSLWLLFSAGLLPFYSDLVDLLSCGSYSTFLVQVVGTTHPQPLTRTTDTANGSFHSAPTSAIEENPNGGSSSSWNGGNYHLSLCNLLEISRPILFLPKLLVHAFVVPNMLLHQRLVRRLPRCKEQVLLPLFSSRLQRNNGKFQLLFKSSSWHFYSTFTGLHLIRKHVPQQDVDFRFTEQHVHWTTCSLNKI